jgi:hypothetical protein
LKRVEILRYTIRQESEKRSREKLSRTNTVIEKSSTTFRQSTLFIHGRSTIATSAPNTPHFGHRSTTTSKTLAKAIALLVLGLVNAIEIIPGNLWFKRPRIVDAVRGVGAVIVTLVALELEWPRLDKLRHTLASADLHADRQLELQ